MTSEGGEASYEPDEDEILVHRFDHSHEDSYFFVGSGYGKGKPNFYVTLDENGGTHSWWLDPENAAALGRRLIEVAEGCGAGNLEQAKREADWRAEHSQGDKPTQAD